MKILGFHEPEAVGKKGSLQVFQDGRVTKYLGKHDMGHVEHQEISGHPKSIEMDFPAESIDKLPIIVCRTIQRAYKCSKAIKEILNATR